MKTSTIQLCILLSMLLAAIAAPAQDKKDSPLGKLKFIKGPDKATMKDVADINVPAGYMFADGKGAQKLLEAMGNIKSGREIGFIAPTSMVWFVVFEFDPIGFVKDDDKDKLDPDAILKSIRKGNDYANKQREKMGASPMQIIGWEAPPHYNAETHNLEWSIRGESEGEPVLNHNTRMLGRKGVMRVTLVADPQQMTNAMPDYKTLLTGYSFQSGERYAEYRAGDKLAKVGLGALIVGGAAVGAAKLGLFAWLAVLLKKGWKLIVVAFAACAAAIKKLFNRITGRAQPNLRQ